MLSQCGERLRESGAKSQQTGGGKTECSDCRGSNESTPPPSPMEGQTGAQVSEGRGTELEAKGKKYIYIYIEWYMER